MFRRRVICTTIGAVLLIIATIIDRVAKLPKGYVAMSFAALLAAYWTVEFVLDLVLYKMSYEKDFDFFVAQKVNRTDLTYEKIMNNKQAYYKEFKRTKLKGKLYQYLKLCFSIGIFILIVVYFFI